MKQLSRLALLTFLFSGLALTIAAAAQDTAPKIEKDQAELSLKSVKLITGFALTTIPSEVKQADGKVIKIDRNNLEKILVPLDDARRIIMAARNSAHAQMCDLPELQAENYLALMRSEQAKNKWSPEQMLFINRLHLFTVMWLTGNVKFVEKDGKKEPTAIAEPDKDGNKEPTAATAEAEKAGKKEPRAVVEPDKAEKKACSEEEKAKVKVNIEAYLKTVKKS